MLLQRATCICYKCIVYLELFEQCNMCLFSAIQYTDGASGCFACKQGCPLLLMPVGRQPLRYHVLLLLPSQVTRICYKCKVSHACHQQDFGNTNAMPHSCVTKKSLELPSYQSRPVCVGDVETPDRQSSKVIISARLS